MNLDLIASAYELLEPPVGPFLGDGASARALLAASLFRATGEVYYRREVIHHLQTAIDNLPDLATPSLFSGLGGVLLAAEECKDLVDIRGNDSIVYSLCESCSHNPSSGWLDLMDGLCGLTPLVAAMSRSSSRDRLAQSLQSAIEAASSPAIFEQWLLDATYSFSAKLGIAHGVLGLALARLYLGDVLGYPPQELPWVLPLLNRARTWMRSDGGWCQGLAGQQMACSALDAQHRVVDHLETALLGTSATDLSVCHGLAGIILCASAIGRRHPRVRQLEDDLLEKLMVTIGSLSDARSRLPAGLLVGFDGVLLAPFAVARRDHPLNRLLLLR